MFVFCFYYFPFCICCCIYAFRKHIKIAYKDINASGISLCGNKCCTHLSVCILYDLHVIKRVCMYAQCQRNECLISALYVHAYVNAPPTRVMQLSIDISYSFLLLLMCCCFFNAPHICTTMHQCTNVCMYVCIQMCTHRFQCALVVVGVRLLAALHPTFSLSSCHCVLHFLAKIALAMRQAFVCRRALAFVFLFAQFFFRLFLPFFLRLFRLTSRSAVAINVDRAPFEVSRRRRLSLKVIVITQRTSVAYANRKLGGRSVPSRRGAH